ncbi:TonB-dependent siderophore receptor [Pseudomonas sp. NPDC007930]|uniref:TonB-dependent receptor n=1 Tax=Pseudomonas sp. NPDC007930 TaxID=3364417 RepID=UPI0036E90732
MPWRHSLLALAIAAPLAQADGSTVLLAPLTTTASAPSAAEAAHDKARNRRASVGPLGSRKVLDTPYSVNVVGHGLLEGQQLKSIKDAYRYLPSVQGDGARPQSRGMQGSVVQNSRLDGLNVVSTTEYPAEQFDRVEVLNGLAGSLYGPANPAGTFNLVSKRPTDFTRNRLTFGLGTGLAWQKAADLSGPFDPAGRLKYRLNLLDEQGHGYAPGSTLRRQLVSLALDARLSEQDVLETHFSHYNYLGKGLPGNFALASGQAFPHALDPTRNHLGQDYAGNNDTTDTASAHWKHDFDGNWKLDLGLLRQIADRESTALTNTLSNAQGAYTTTASTSTASRFTIDSYLLNLSGHADTGFIGHDLGLGLTGFDWKNYNPVAGAAVTVGEGNLSAPAGFAEPAYPDFTDRYHSATATQRSLVLADTLAFSPQWSLMLSASQSHLAASNWASTGARKPGASASGWSQGESLIYKPIDDATLYLTYADSLQQGDTASAGSANANTVLAPYRSRQWEVGAKYALGGANLALALFQIKRPYAYTQSDNVYAVGGEQRNRGVEWMVDGQATANLHLYGGLTWLQPLLFSHDPSKDGTQVVGLPKYAGNLLAVYQLPALPGVALNANLHYVGKRPTDNQNDHWVASYNTLDLGGSFTTRVLQRHTVYRLQVTNLGNAHYWTNIVPGALNGYSGVGNASAQLGAPRMLQASVQVDL